MSQYTPGVKVSIEAADTIPAHRVVVGDTAATRTCLPFQTSTSMILGVTEFQVNSGAAASVIVSGTAKLSCYASVAAWTLVGPATASSGHIVTRTETTVTSNSPLIGLAMESGSTNSVIEVMLQIINRTAGL